MKKILILLIVAGLFACGNSTNEQSTQETSTESEVNPTTKSEVNSKAESEVNSTTELVSDEVPNQAIEEPEEEPVTSPHDAYLGYYVGSFKASRFRESRRPSYINKINISIDKITEDSIYGHSVVAGNDRPFKGAYEMEGTVYSAIVKEPGDDRYDGVFYFKLNPNEKRVKGTWHANNQNLAVYERSFNLSKRTFKYDPDLDLPEDVSWAELYSRNTSEEFVEEGEFLTEDVLKINASNRLLKKEEVENMYKGDLEIIRNAIYARHGYSFKNRKSRYIFDSYVDWYMPVSTDIRAKLTSIELQNIDLLKRYEQHADRYYDVFGR